MNKKEIRSRLKQYKNDKRFISLLNEMNLTFCDIESHHYHKIIKSLNAPKKRRKPLKKKSNVNYYEYIKSDKWKKFKQRFRRSKLCHNECYICGSKKEIHIHHKTYKRLGNERLGDVTELCKKCHFRLHELLNENESTRTNLWNISKKLKKQYQRKGYI